MANMASQELIRTRLKKIRKSKGLSQEEVALGMGYANNGLISRVERNVTDIRLSLLNDIAEFYDVDICDLIME